jgi:KDO2-lipid IV(A) lauroyltransferase
MLLASAPINEVMTTSPPMRDTDRVALYRFLGPRFWPIWLGLGLVRALNVLPLPAQLTVGRALGRLAYRFARRDRRVASINIALCLPGLSAEEREELVREHFESLGCTLLETGLVWWASDKRLRQLIQFDGEEHLRAKAR